MSKYLSDSKKFDTEKYEKLKKYNSLIENSLKDLTDKLESKQLENFHLKSENEKLFCNFNSLRVKLDLAENKIQFLEKQLDLFERESKINTNNYESNESNGFRFFNKKLNEEILCLNEKLDFEKKTNSNLEKQLLNFRKEIEDMRENSFYSDSSSEIEKKHMQMNNKKGLTFHKKASLDSLSSTNSDRKLSLQQDFDRVLAKARNKKSANFINKTDNVEKEFADSIIELAVETVDKEFMNYSELSNYMRNKIQEIYGLYCVVTVGKYDYYNSSSWSICGRKSLSFKIRDLGFAIFQIHVECNDLVKTLRTVSKVEVLSRNEFVDKEFENFMTKLALDSIGKNFKNYEQMSQFVSNSIGHKFGKKWLVLIGVYDNYDLCLNLSINNKRKFIELLVKDLRFTIFQAI